MTLGVLSSVHLQNYFWKISGLSLLVSFSFLYVTIVNLNLGYLGMTLGFSIKFLSELVMMLVILFIYGKKEIFILPKLKEVFSDLGEIIKFAFNYSMGTFALAFTFEIISLVIIKSKDGTNNLMIWVSICQIINLIYEIGQGVGTYSRTLENHFIGTGNLKKVKYSFHQCLKYHFLLTFAINIIIFCMAWPIGNLIIEDETFLSIFVNYLRLVCIFLPFDSMMPLINSFLRVLNHNLYCMFLNVFEFFLLLGIIYSLLWHYNYEHAAFCSVCGLIGCSIVINFLGFVRIYVNLDFYLISAIELAIENDRKNLSDEQELESDEVLEKDSEIIEGDCLLELKMGACSPVEVS